MPVLRPMLAADIEPALALWHATEGMGLGDVDEPEKLTAYLQRNPGLSVVAEDDGRLVGAALCGHDGRRGYLYHVAVAKACRGQGLGQALVRAGLDGLAGAGMTKCHLFVFTSNEDGIAFWNHTGWTRRGDVAVFSRSTE